MILRKKEIYDHPNHRSSHMIPTPRGGGIGIFIAFILVFGWSLDWTSPDFALSDWTWFFLGAVSIFWIGIWDDFHSARRRTRLAIQLFASVCLLLWLMDPFQKWIYSLSQMAILSRIFSDYPIHLLGQLQFISVLMQIVILIGFVWVINLYNFMDGINGIAGLQSAFMGLSISFLVYTSHGYSEIVLGFLVLAFASLGFLVWNFPIAKVFLGDCGSNFIGYMLAGFSAWSYLSGSIEIWSLLVLSSLFWIDATFTLFKRAYRRERIFDAHKDHVYQILSRLWNSHSYVSLLFLFINCFILFPISVWIQSNPDWGWYVFLGLMILYLGIYTFLSNLSHKTNGTRTTT
ncbi:MraY family glycosyltransferase [Leptospira sp. GIMC2001]|uniref:MraY family glycosyltransferase n=1 Tax=Leptospira sp. GIMC2001 TaxID=1513297 RepID=UPI00234AB431|nr:glycosyltransferase family 4 protein [Leptospira sp. GIMC2001]WCL51183.1 glycosyltransferase family 4 protein [Leptospira sp. GIMC2001]